MALRAEVVAVGDELLSGARINTNAAWLGTRLAAVGVRVAHAEVVGDDIDAIVSALRTAATRAEFVVVTGGLGPTSDDRTRDALAVLLGGGLASDERSVERIRSWYAARDRVPTDDVLMQALVPVGASALPNNVGTAPGLRAEVDGAVIICLPGVPAEMIAIMDDSVLVELRALTGDQVAVATLRTVLTSETVVAAAMADVEARAQAAGVEVAYLPSVAEVVVRFVTSGPGSAAVVDSLAEEAAHQLGDIVAVRGDATLAQEVVRLARGRGATVAVAESLTGGLVAAALTDVPGASEVVRGAVVPYATDLKAGLLGIDADLLARVGAVDAEVARAMALGVRERLGADVGLALTGVAGPDPQDGHLPGTLHLALSSAAGAVVVSPSLKGSDRGRIRAAAVVHALDLLRRSLLGLPPPG